MIEALGQAPKAYETHDIPNSEKNKLFHSDRQFHDWYRFVLSFPPQLVREYLRHFSSKPGKHKVLDPFCGTGTTLVEAKFGGFESFGFEANRLAEFASRVKLAWNVDAGKLLEVAQDIRDNVGRSLQTLGIVDDLDSSDIPIHRLKVLEAEKRSLLLTNSISPLPLHKALLLIEEIERHNYDRPLYEALLLAVANVVVFKSSNLRFGPEVGLGRIKQDAPVIAPWYQQVEQMSRDLHAVEGQEFPEAHLVHADSRQIEGRLPRKSISAVITSPPYPNEKDYTRTTRLESVLLGLITSKEELRNVKKSLVRSNTRGVYKGDDDDIYVRDIGEVQRIAAEIERRRIDLGKTSGFERLYARVTKLYFGGMARHLTEIKPYLKKGAKLAYVVGDQASYLQVMIRTGQILATIAESLGYVDSQVIPFRTRFSTATKSDLNEEVVVFTWPR